MFDDLMTKNQDNDNNKKEVKRDEFDWLYY
jgi:hypothetical protein